MTKVATLTASVLVTLGLAVGTAPSSLADDEGGVAMPDLRGGSLADAKATMADIGLPLDSINIVGYPQTQKAPKMWVVCSQLPRVGEPLAADSYAAVGVVRKGQSCSG